MVRTGSRQADRRVLLLGVCSETLQCFGGQETPGVYLLGEPRHKGLGPSWTHRPRGQEVFSSYLLSGSSPCLVCLFLPVFREDSFAFTLVRASKTEIVFHTQARLQGEAVTSR